MRAAVIHDFSQGRNMANLPSPWCEEDGVPLTAKAALSNLVRGQASGSH